MVAKYDMNVPAGSELTLPEIEAAASALLIEQDEDIAKLIRRLVQPKGLIVHIVPTGQDAEDFISKSSPTDVVIMDLLLADIDGFELISQIREDALWRYVPVIALAGKVSEKDIARAFELGVNEYVSKPFHPQDFLARLGGFVSLQSWDRPGQCNGSTL